MFIINTATLLHNFTHSPYKSHIILFISKAKKLYIKAQHRTHKLAHHKKSFTIFYRYIVYAPCILKCVYYQCILISRCVTVPDVSGVGGFTNPSYSSQQKTKTLLNVYQIIICLEHHITVLNILKLTSCCLGLKLKFVIYQ